MPLLRTSEGEMQGLIEEDAMSFSQDELNNCTSIKCYEIFLNNLAWLSDHLILTVRSVWPPTPTSKATESP